MYKHLFFDMDQTLAPARQLILPEMFNFVSQLPQDIIIVSGQEVAKIEAQSNQLVAYRLGQNGNHAVDPKGNELWHVPLQPNEREEIMSHINKLLASLDEEPNPEWHPIEDRGAQITFSPVGNTAPNEIKKIYDPNRKKREAMLEKIPFVSENMIVKLGGSTSLDYFHKDRHKGFNVQKLIELKGWQKSECLYFGDGLFPGGNDEAVIGVIETVSVRDHLHTYELLQQLLKSGQLG